MTPYLGILIRDVRKERQNKYLLAAPYSLIFGIKFVTTSFP